MKPSLPLTLLALLVLCLVVPAAHAVAAFIGAFVMSNAPPYPPPYWDPDKAVTVAIAVACVSVLVGFWHWWDVYAYRGPKLGADYEPRDPRWCLATVSAIHLVVMPAVLTAMFCLGIIASKNWKGDVELSFAAYPRSGSGYELLYLYPLLAFLLCRWFAKTEGKPRPDRGTPLRVG